MLDQCSFLKEYMTFVDYVRENHRENGYEELADAIERAIDRCIKEEILKDFLMEHRSEVVKVMQLDYTFDRQITLEREEGREEGFAEGRAEGQVEGLKKGREEGKKQIISNMLKKGMQDTDIMALVECEQKMIDEVREKL